MGNWRDVILREFAPNVAKLTLVADPDGLLLEEGVLEGVRERGFDLIPFEDPIAFRYAFESQYRARWDRGEATELVVVLRSPTQDLQSLPFDLLHAGRKLSFHLGDIFPNLSYQVIAAMDRADPCRDVRISHAMRMATRSIPPRGKLLDHHPSTVGLQAYRMMAHQSAQ